MAASRATVANIPLTRLERAVMAALAHELCGTIPDLAAQFAAAKASQRRNMAFGAYTGLTLDRPHPATTADGAFGTVHVMIDGLQDAVVFQALMRHGTVAALQADSYGQDTRAINFDTVGFEQVFTLDAQGRSIPFEPRPSSDDDRPIRRSAPPAPRHTQRPVQQATPMRPAPQPAPRPQTDKPQPASSERDRAFTFGPNGAVSTPPPIPPGTGFGSRSADLPDIASLDDKTLRIGLWAAIAVVAFLIVTIFQISWIFVLVPGVWLAQIIRRPAVLSAIRKALVAWQASARTAAASGD
ncbi:hypothetical protein [uncultured Brevundimonas sp.]|uniref:hypothetical protein n=1 Tax=uncultured Brevundimonas sp. TaxID=213418 RepID=UPI0025FDA696|nr:hypothetical protein [uncultured Brevundimonas sp.]